MKTTLHKAFLFTYLFILLQINITAQIEGLWVVNKVLVDTEELTPIAKWVKLEADGTQFSGNGWLQHTFGTWKYDAITTELSFQSEPGPEDEFGAFKVKYNDQKMTWERTEEGQKVIVELEKTNDLPKSSADQLQGIWDLIKITKNDQNITNQYDKNNKAYIFIRWDRMYVERTPEEERITGFWYINAHRPELQLISHHIDKANEKWRISFSDSTMTWFGLDENNKNEILIYKRIKTFPE